MYKLNKNLTVYSSELIAILKALEWINENKPENVVILTDSLSSLQSIQSGKSRTRQDLLDQVLYLKVIYKGCFKSFVALYADRICSDQHFVENRIEKFLFV